MGYLLAFLSAVLSTAFPVLAKRWFSLLAPMEMYALPLLFGFPVGLAVLAFLPWPGVQPDFWGWLGAVVILEFVAGSLVMHAIRVSPLSLSMPWLALTPVFLLFLGGLLLNEQVSGMGAAGVLAVLAGGAVLQASTARQSLLRGVLREPGPRAMGLAAVVLAADILCIKQAILRSSPLFFTALFYAAAGPVTVGALAAIRRVRLEKLVSMPWAGLAVGSLCLVNTGVDFAAFALIPSAYAIGIKRLSILFTILAGGLFFGEGDMKTRLAAGSVMVLGTVLIAFSG